MSFKKCKVLLLPTNEKSKLVLSYCNELAINWTHDLAKFDDATYQNLYFLSDEEIKEGDWIGYPNLNTWVPVQYLGGDLTSKERKIIATTDKSLIIPYDGKTPISENWGGYKLPQPSQSFIEKFVEEYNKGNVITEVMVEYEDKVAMDGHTIIGSELKISKDNTITIRKVKDSWNREEVKQLFDKMYATDIVDANVLKVDFDKWIEENL